MEGRPYSSFDEVFYSTQYSSFVDSFSFSLFVKDGSIEEIGLFIVVLYFTSSTYYFI